MDDDQQFCLRWNNHQSTLVSVFDTLLEKGMHVDCTLAAEGQTLKAHKVVLSACSPYFESVLSQQYDKHPIIILKDVKYAELRAMMDYMYRGEVNISQDQLAALLKAAESLQIKGLSDNKPSRPASLAPAPAPAAPAPPPDTTLQQARDGSVDSREGSASPSRRRKKARRLSQSPARAAEPEPCKDEPARDPVEDLTIDEDADDPPNVTHNDVVRNFQWHMERSQDEIMNSSDSVRDSQDATSPRQNIVTRSKKVIDEPTGATTFAILKNVTSPNVVRDDAKENDKRLPPLPLPPLKQEADVPADGKPEDELKAGGEAGAPHIKREKGYKCGNCGRAYNARKNLVRHATIECGREPKYKCPSCNYRNHRRNELKKHIEKKHSKQPKLRPSPGPRAGD